jgi:hypothetical protein
LELARNAKRCPNLSASEIELLTDGVEKRYKNVFETKFYSHELYGKRNLGGQITYARENM